mmetsp:Transcript_13161/g.24396  ORF Transcript_13161/g.24396 Transcript_13161/m.24396 type:complete len:515 (-) Transcript_13161:62-1606(-)
MLCRVRNCWKESVVGVVSGCFVAVELVGSLAVELYMATRTPVAHNTRSRHRKRPGTLVKGLSPPRKASGGNKGKVHCEKEEGDLAVPERAISPARALTPSTHRVKAPKPTVIGRRKKRMAAANTSASESKYELVVQEDAGSQSSSLKSENYDEEKGNDNEDRTAIGSENNKTEHITSPLTTPSPKKSSSKKDKAASNEATTCAQDEQATEASVVVHLVEELEPLEDPKAAATQMLEFAKSAEWLEQYEAVTLTRRLVNCHADTASGSVYDNMETILELLRSSVESLRSAQSRNALFAISEVFEHLPSPDVLIEGAGASLNGMVDAVVLKAVNDKKFIASAGETVLQRMTETTPCIPVLLALLSHAKSKSIKVCTVISRSAARCLRGILSDSNSKDKIPSEETLKHFKNMLLKEDRAKEIVGAFAELELSRSVDAKKPAQDSLRKLNKILSAQEFEKVLKEVTTPSNTAHILTLVNKPALKAKAKAPSLRDIMAEKRRAMMKQGNESVAAQNATL